MNQPIIPHSINNPINIQPLTQNVNTQALNMNNLHLANQNLNPNLNPSLNPNLSQNLNLNPSINQAIANQVCQIPQQPLPTSIFNNSIAAAAAAVAVANAQATASTTQTTFQPPNTTFNHLQPSNIVVPVTVQQNLLPNTQTLGTVPIHRVSAATRIGGTVIQPPPPGMLASTSISNQLVATAVMGRTGQIGLPPQQGLVNNVGIASGANLTIHQPAIW